MLNAEWMGRAMVEQAGRIKKAAEGIAPERTGRYRWGVVRYDPSGQPTTVTRRRKKPPTGRGVKAVQGGGGFHVQPHPIRGTVGALLYNNTPYAYFLERGTKYMRRQRILGRAIDAAKAG